MAGRMTDVTGKLSKAIEDVMKHYRKHGEDLARTSSALRGTLDIMVNRVTRAKKAWEVMADKVTHVTNKAGASIAVFPALMERIAAKIDKAATGAILARVAAAMGGKPSSEMMAKVAAKMGMEAPPLVSVPRVEGTSAMAGLQEVMGHLAKGPAGVAGRGRVEEPFWPGRLYTPGGEGGGDIGPGLLEKATRAIEPFLFTLRDVSKSFVKLPLATAKAFYKGFGKFVFKALPTALKMTKKIGDMFEKLDPMASVTEVLSDIFGVWGDVLMGAFLPALTPLYDIFLSDEMIAGMEGIGEAMGEIFTAAMPLIEPLVGLIAPFLGLVAIGIGALAMPLQLLAIAFEFLGPFISPLTGAVDLLSTALGLWDIDMSDVLDTVKTWAADLGVKLKSGWDTFKDDPKKWFEDLGTAISVWWNDMWDKILNRGIYAGTGGGKTESGISLSSYTESGTREQSSSSLGAAALSITSALEAFKSGEEVSVGDWIREYFASFKWFAEGGIAFGPTPGIIAEAGPEAVIPLDRLSEFTGGGGGTTINVYVGGSVTTERDLVDAISERLATDGNLVGF